MNHTNAQSPLAGISGRSRDGQPLAFHRAPAPELAPWIARLFVTVVDQPAGNTVDCGLFNDTAFVRLIVGGHWTGETAEGPVTRTGGALLFGPHSRRMPIRVTGPFATFGFALRPGAMASLDFPWGPIGLDRIADIAPGGEWSEWTRPIAFASRDGRGWLDWLEGHLGTMIARRRPPPPAPLAAAFAHAALADPSEPIGAFAAREGASMRTVARMTRRDFQLTPKQVMRRARVLDMASQLLGLADRAEAEEHAMRFYDQSHQIRDFRALMGMTPRALARAPRPVLALGLETRQALRLESLGRLADVAAAPWR
jgi:AraC-like DNA-binding protein